MAKRRTPRFKPPPPRPNSGAGRQAPPEGAVTKAIRAELADLEAPAAHHLVVLALSLAALQDASPSAATARELRITMKEVAGLDGAGEREAREAMEAARG